MKSLFAKKNISNQKPYFIVLPEVFFWVTQLQFDWDNLEYIITKKNVNWNELFIFK